MTLWRPVGLQELALIFVPDQFGLKAKTAVEQFRVLTDWLAYSSFDVWCEIGANAKAVYLNYLYWRRGCTPEGRQLTDSENKLINFIEHRWSHLACGFPLPNHTESV